MLGTLWVWVCSAALYVLYGDVFVQPDVLVHRIGGDLCLVHILLDLVSLVQPQLLVTMGARGGTMYVSMLQKAYIYRLCSVMVTNRVDVGQCCDPHGWNIFN